MGNSCQVCNNNSKVVININDNKIDEQLQIYRFERREFDGLYGISEIHRNQNHYHDNFKRLQIVKFNLKFNNENRQETQDKVEVIKNLINIQSQNIIQILRIEVQNQELLQFIWSDKKNQTIKFRITQYYYQDNLSKRILQKQLSNQPYSETDIKQLISTVINAMKDINQQQMYHGQLSAQSIRFNGQDETKIQLSFQDVRHKVIQNLSEFIALQVPLAPEILQQQNNAQNITQSQISCLLKYNYQQDVFSLGIISLQIATLNNFDHFYSFHNQSMHNSQYNFALQINRDNINEALQTVKKKYSQQLSDLISKMVENDQNIRPSFVTLSQDSYFLGQQQQ